MNRNRHANCFCSEAVQQILYEYVWTFFSKYAISLNKPSQLNWLSFIFNYFFDENKISHELIAFYTEMFIAFLLQKSLMQLSFLSMIACVKYLIVYATNSLIALERSS